jgi:hypothetical protein
MVKRIKQEAELQIVILRDSARVVYLMELLADPCSTRTRLESLGVPSGGSISREKTPSLLAAQQIAKWEVEAPASRSSTAVAVPKVLPVAERTLGPGVQECEFDSVATGSLR